MSKLLYRPGEQLGPRIDTKALLQSNIRAVRINVEFIGELVKVLFSRRLIQKQVDRSQGSIKQGFRKTLVLLYRTTRGVEPCRTRALRASRNWSTDSHQAAFSPRHMF